MPFSFNHFVRGRFRHYLSWTALLALPWVVHQEPSTVGVLMILAGATLRAYASGFIDKEARLSIAGPFAFVRNPLYIGTLIMACGVAQTQNSWRAMTAVFCVGIALIFAISRAEEQVLMKKFPNTFPSYRREVPRFFPRLTKFGSFAELGSSEETRALRFSKALFLKNRGYEALVTAAGLIVLLLIVNVAKQYIHLE